MLEETLVFIEDKYLSLIRRHFGNGEFLDIDINQFAITLARSQGLWCKGVYFYTAPPFQSSDPTAEETKRKSNHDKFVSGLRKISNFYVREGRCQKIDGKFKQKGVDTHLIIDLMDLFSPSKRNITKIILLACDTDFVPILNKIRKGGIEVILFYFTDFVRNSKFSMSNHILTACDRSVLLTKDYFDRSMMKRNKPTKKQEN